MFIQLFINPEIEKFSRRLIGIYHETYKELINKELKNVKKEVI